MRPSICFILCLIRILSTRIDINWCYGCVSVVYIGWSMLGESEWYNSRWEWHRIITYFMSYCLLCHMVFILWLSFVYHIYHWIFPHVVSIDFHANAFPQELGIMGSQEVVRTTSFLGQRFVYSVKQKERSGFMKLWSLLVNLLSFFFFSDIQNWGSFGDKISVSVCFLELHS